MTFRCWIIMKTKIIERFNAALHCTMSCMVEILNKGIENITDKKFYKFS